MVMSIEDTESYLESFMQLSEDKKFIGREVLLWFWYKADSDKKFSVTIPSGKTWQVFLWVDDKIVLESLNARSHGCTLKGGDPCHSEEAAAALSSGKSIKEIRFGIHIEDIGDFRYTLKNDDLQPLGLELPDEIAALAQDSDRPIYELRLECMELFFQVYEQLLQEFLQERCSVKWNNDFLINFKNWIMNKQQLATKH